MMRHIKIQLPKVHLQRKTILRSQHREALIHSKKINPEETAFVLNIIVGMAMRIAFQKVAREDTQVEEVIGLEAVFIGLGEIIIGLGAEVIELGGRN